MPGGWSGGKTPPGWALPRRLTWTGLAYRARNRSAVNVISEPSAAIHAGPRISSSASGGHARGAPMRSPRADLDRPLQLVAGAQRVLAVQPLGVQKGKPGKHFGVGRQSSCACCSNHADQRTARVAPSPPSRRGGGTRPPARPGVAGRLHHHLDPLGVFRQPRPQRVQLVWVGAKPVTPRTRIFPARLPAMLDAQHGKLRRLPSEFSISCLPLSLDLVVEPGKTTPTRSAEHPDIRYQGSDRHHRRSVTGFSTGRTTQGAVPGHPHAQHARSQHARCSGLSPR